VLVEDEELPPAFPLKERTISCALPYAPLSDSAVKDDLSSIRMLTKAIQRTSLFKDAPAAMSAGLHVTTFGKPLTRNQQVPVTQCPVLQPFLSYSLGLAAVA